MTMRAKNLITAIALSCLLGSPTAYAQEPAATTIDVAVALSGPYRLFGQQFIDGLSVSPLAQTTTFNPLDTACSKAGGEAAAQNSQASIIIGFACVDALDAAQQSGALANKTIIVPFSAPVTEAPATDTSAFAQTVFFGPQPDHETATLARYITTNWRSAAIAIIDDGTLYGREIAQQMQIAIAEAGLSPVFTTTFRPQLENQVALVRLLQRAGATHVIVGGDRFDGAAIARASEVISYPLALAGGTAFGAGVAEGTLPEGTVYVSFPDWSAQPAARELAAALDETGAIAEGFAFWGYATGQLLAQWLAIGPVSAQTFAQTLASQPWPTIFGPLRFDADGHLKTNIYTLTTVEAAGTNDTN